MVSTISIFQANLQHSIAASGILTRTIGARGIDLALIQKSWYRDGCQWLGYSRIYPVLCERKG